MKLLILTQAVDTQDSNLGFFHRWIEEFAKNCEKVTVICLREGEYHFASNVEVFSLGKEKGASRLARVARFFKYMVQERNNYDGVFVHMNPEYIVLGGLFWRLWNKPIVLWYAHKSVTITLRTAMLFVNFVCTVSKDSFKIKTSKLRVVGHGIDTDLFKPHGKEASPDIRIITTGRIAPSKHLLEMLEVLDILHAKGRPFIFTIAGSAVSPAEEAYEKLLKEKITASQYSANVHMIGALSHSALPSLLKDQDVFINFATTGNMDKAALEALAMGIPLVTTNEAFRAIADDELQVEPDDSLLLADVITRSKGLDVHSLTEYVQENHSLKGLIPRILALYKKE